MSIVRHSRTAQGAYATRRVTALARTVAYEHMTIAQPSIWQRLRMLAACFA